ncbi:hypothetical protein Avbf_10957 [Armadillidium vulgare]|nr:hypothetical protein Avbf_10957 [Armadillidium vulgare]
MLLEKVTINKKQRKERELKLDVIFRQLTLWSSTYFTILRLRKPCDKRRKVGWKGKASAEKKISNQIGRNENVLSPKKSVYEEEETWISGEELFTEGSSDDEGHTSKQSRTHHHLHMLERRISAPPNLNKWQLSLQESSEPVLRSLFVTQIFNQIGFRREINPKPERRDEPHLTETTRRFSQMGVELPQRAQQELRGHTEQDRKKEKKRLKSKEKLCYGAQKEGH